MGTLVYDPFFREVPAFFGVSLEELFEIKHPTTWIEYERGEIDELEMQARYFQDGRSFDLEALKRCMREHYRWLPGMAGLVRELGQGSSSLHALSNYPEWFDLIDEKLGLSDQLDGAFLSWRIGVRKPDPEIYRYAADKLGVDPGHCLFVDDVEGNCEGARAVGMQAVRFAGAAQLRSHLVDLGLLA